MAAPTLAWQDGSGTPISSIQFASPDPTYPAGVILAGQSSTPVAVRLANSGAGSAYDVRITTHDGVGLSTDTELPVSQQWVKLAHVAYKKPSQSGNEQLATGNNTDYQAIGGSGAYRIPVNMDSSAGQVAGDELEPNGYFKFNVRLDVPAGTTVTSVAIALVAEYSYLV